MLSGLNIRPGDVPTEDEVPMKTQRRLADALKRFEQIRGNPQYNKISELPEFQSTYNNLQSIMGRIRSTSKPTDSPASGVQGKFKDIKVELKDAKAGLKDIAPGLKDVRPGFKEDMPGIKVELNYEEDNFEENKPGSRRKNVAPAGKFPKVTPSNKFPEVMPSGKHSKVTPGIGVPEAKAGTQQGLNFEENNFEENRAARRDKGQPKGSKSDKVGSGDFTSMTGSGAGAGQAAAGGESAKAGSGGVNSQTESGVGAGQAAAGGGSAKAGAGKGIAGSGAGKTGANSGKAKGKSESDSKKGTSGNATSKSKTSGPFQSVGRDHLVRLAERSY